MSKLRVRDLMTTEMVTLQPTDTLKKAAIRLAVDNSTAAPIVDKKNHMIGFLSEYDILEVIMRYQLRLSQRDDSGMLLDQSMDLLDENDVVKEMNEEISNIPVSSVMRYSVMTTSPDAPIIDVLKVMVEMSINRIPVLEKGVLVGIISRSDIIFALYKKKA